MPEVNPKFWIKTALHALTPGGYGYHRKIRGQADPNYVHERDKHPVRHKHHGGGGWKAEAQDGVWQRDYASYEEYVTHQKLKLDEMMKMKGGFTNQDIMNYRLKFYRRFKHLPALLPQDATIICAGARQGTEVEVLRDIGFHKAQGIDLNPGPGNPLVKPGDFMHLENADDSVDLIYTNCIDHAFDLPAFFKEHARVLKPGGFVLYDLGVNMEKGGGPFEAVAWERTEDIFKMVLSYFEKLIHVEREKQWMWVLMQGKRATK
jgi:hypothetical protein